jgi:hypothetical protein
MDTPDRPRPALRRRTLLTGAAATAGANYGLHLAVSADGLNWTPLNQNSPVVTPTAGTLGLRDPFILRKTDGTFVILATDLNGTDFTQNNQFIHVWSSTDLRTFTGYHRLKLHSLATHSWAPEAYWDAGRGQYAIIYSANNGSHDVIMVDYTTDFATATGRSTFFDPGYAAIDGDLASSGGVNYLYFKTTPTAAFWVPGPAPSTRAASACTQRPSPPAGAWRRPSWYRPCPAARTRCGATRTTRTGASSRGRPRACPAVRGHCSMTGRTPSR